MSFLYRSNPITLELYLGLFTYSGQMRALEHLEQAKISSLELQVKTNNLKAIKLYEKFEFIRMGSIRAAACINDEYIDEYIYQRLSSLLKENLENKESVCLD